MRTERLRRVSQVLQQLREEICLAKPAQARIATEDGQKRGTSQLRLSTTAAKKRGWVLT